MYFRRSGWWFFFFFFFCMPFITHSRSHLLIKSQPHSLAALTLKKKKKKSCEKLFCVILQFPLQSSLGADSCATPCLGPGGRGRLGRGETARECHPCTRAAPLPSPIPASDCLPRVETDCFVNQSPAVLGISMKNRAMKSVFVSDLGDSRKLKVRARSLPPPPFSLFSFSFSRCCRLLCP